MNIIMRHFCYEWMERILEIILIAVFSDWLHHQQQQGKCFFSSLIRWRLRKTLNDS